MAAYRIPPKVLAQAVGDEVVLLDLTASKYFSLNRTAAYVWRWLTAPQPGMGEADYASRFRVTPEQALRDFADTRRQLVERGFLVEG
jgi:hypothetical protein